MSLYRDRCSFLLDFYMTKKNTELETGKIKIADNVYATIVSMTALDTKGIHHMSSTFNDGVNTFFWT